MLFGKASDTSDGSGNAYWLASSYVNANSNNSNFGLRNVNSDGNVNNYNLWNSNGNTNNPSLGVRAVASKKLWLLLLRYSKRSFR